MFPIYIFKQKHAMLRSREGEGVQGSRSLLENHEAIGFLSRTGHRVKGGGGGRGLGSLLENQDILDVIGFVSKTGLDLKITKLPNQHSILLGHYQPTNEMPFKWRFAGRPKMAHF